MTPREAPNPRSTRTRARILQAAMQLFAEHGYDQVTVARIAAEVGISEMTFFRHFPAKEALVVDDPYDPLMAEHVAAQPRELPVLTRVARGIRAAWSAVPPPEADAVRERLRVAAGSPALRAATARANEASVEAVAAALRETGVDAIAARIAASAAFTGITEALLAWSTQTGGELGDALEGALGILEGAR